MGKVEKVKWQGIDAVKFEFGDYKALLLLEIGGNLISLKKESNGKTYDILKGPDKLEEYKAFPVIYGIPVLFPPNRIDGGKFKIGSQMYQFPINEPSRNNSVHGFLENKEWELESTNVDDNGVEIKIKFENNSYTDFYKYFPHDCEIINVYRLSENGLSQKIEIKNLSDREMPLGIGYHTAFKLPFVKDGNKKNILLKISIGEKIEVNERMLPTEKILPLNSDEIKFRTEGNYPLSERMDNHYTVKNIFLDNTNSHKAILEDNKEKVKVIYEVGNKFKYWMIWNKNANEDFVCLEPQSWMINAPNLKTKESGLIILKPLETWKEETKIYIQES